MSKATKPKMVRQREPTDEERAAGLRLNGIVMLVLVFSVLNLSWILSAAGLSPISAIIAAVLAGGIITLAVKRYLEQRYRERFPG